jgi:hypothetical protein
MKFTRTSLSFIAVSLFVLQCLATTARAESNHAINTKGCVCPKGKAKTIELPADESATLPTGLGRWVARISYSECPKGTTEYVAGDGGAKCWAGPV